MPIYEFECRKCGEQFELLLPNRAAADRAVCAGCASPDVRRLMSAFFGRRGSADGSPPAIAGAAGGCTGCTRSTCAGCKAQ